MKLLMHPKGFTSYETHKVNTVVGGVLLIVLAAAPYLQTLRYDFINYDDNLYVSENPHVHQGLTWHTIAWALTTFRTGNWHPITWLSHMLDVTIWGMNPGGHHLTNVVLHVLNTLLLFVILIEMTKAPWRAALVAALFAVHPLHVESVAWVAERKDVLSTLFGLLAIWAYVAYVRQPAAKRYFVVLGLFILSLATKPMLVTLPFLLLLLDVWPLGRFKGQRSHVRCQVFVEKIPLLAIAAISSTITIVAQRSAGTVSSFSVLSLVARVSNAIIGYRMYIDKLIVPIKLAVFYPNPRHWQAIDLAASSMILLIISSVAIAQRRQCPWLLIGWLWFLGTLVPVIGMVQVGMQSIADRYAYIPAVGIFIMIAWSLPTKLSPFARRSVIAASSAWVLTLMVLTWIQVSYWKNSRTLFTHATRVTQGNYIADQNLGNVLQDEGDLDAALEHYQKAANEYPEYATIHEDIGNVLLLKGRFDEALPELNYAADLNPNSSTAFNSMGWIYLTTRHYERAARLFRHAIDLNPENEFAQVNYGTALVSLGRYEEAIAQLAPMAQAGGPDQVDARTNLALALAGRGDVDQAVAELQQVLQVAPDYRPAWEALQEIEAKKK